MPLSQAMLTLWYSMEISSYSKWLVSRTSRFKFSFTVSLTSWYIVGCVEIPIFSSRKRGAFIIKGNVIVESFSSMAASSFLFCFIWFVVSLLWLIIRRNIPYNNTIKNYMPEISSFWLVANHISHIRYLLSSGVNTLETIRNISRDIINFSDYLTGQARLSGCQNV